MKNITLLVISILIFAGVDGLGQSREYTVQNIKLNLEGNELVVNYDLIGRKTFKPVPVRLVFYDSQYRIYVPNTVSPGPRESVEPGLNRSIAWDFQQDIKRLDVLLKPYLIPGEVSSHHFGMGPEAALFSLAVPGLGNYFVGDTRHQTIKPWMKTISAWGLITLGTIASQDRTREPPTINPNSGFPWRMGDWNYKYFENDAEFLIAAGILIWAADVVWVAIKGNHNRKLKRHILGMNVVYK